MPPAKRMWQCFSLNFSICQALLYNPRIGVRGPTRQTCRASLAYSALAECCRPMQKYRDRQKALSLFRGKPSTNLPGLRGWQSGWLLCTTLPRTAADAWLEAYWPQATSKAPALLQAMKAIWPSFTHLSTAQAVIRDGP